MREIEAPFVGRLEMRIGDAEDYRALERFHYVAGRPATFALVLAVVYVEGSGWQAASLPHGRVVAVGVLSYPALSGAMRERALGLGRVAERWRWAFVNRHVRTISRVIVHPQFRGIGLAGMVVRELLRQAPTRYVEAISRLASHHPLFARAGMRCVNAGAAEEAAYYLSDRVDDCG